MLLRAGDVRRAHPAPVWNTASGTKKPTASPGRRVFVRGPDAISASKCEIDCTHDEEIRDEDVPRWTLAKEQVDDDSEHDEGDALLHDLELCDRERLRTDAVCGYLERVLRQRDEPTHQDHQQQ